MSEVVERFQEEPASVLQALSGSFLVAANDWNEAAANSDPFADLLLIADNDSEGHNRDVGAGAVGATAAGATAAALAPSGGHGGGYSC